MSQSNQQKPISSTVDNWIDASSISPGQDEIVLAFGPVGFYVAGYEDGEWFSIDSLGEIEVTHWMPLPSAPNE